MAFPIPSSESSTLRAFGLPHFASISRKNWVRSTESAKRRTVHVQRQLPGQRAMKRRASWPLALAIALCGGAALVASIKDFWCQYQLCQRIRLTRVSLMFVHRGVANYRERRGAMPQWGDLVSELESFGLCEGISLDCPIVDDIIPDAKPIASWITQPMPGYYVDSRFVVADFNGRTCTFKVFMFTDRPREKDARVVLFANGERALMTDVALRNAIASNELVPENELFYE